MTALELVLLVCGVICVVLSFVLTGKNEDTATNKELNSDLTDQQKEEIKKQIDDMVNEELENINEKTEASLDKISNTKMLEMNDYAETIMGEINRNHNETVFLYDMLNEKAKEIKNTVKDVNMAKRQVEKIQSEVTFTSEDKNGDDVQAATVEEGQNNKTVRDDAKERLSELVRQSNEKAKKQNPEIKGHQANSLNNMVKESTAEAKEEAKDNEDITKIEKVAVTVDHNADHDNAAADHNLSDEAVKNDHTTDLKEETSSEVESEAIVEAETVATVEVESDVESSQAEEAKTDADEKESKKMNIQFEKGTINNDKILKLSQSGMTNKEIAKELNLGIGEVKLVIDLYHTEQNN